MKVEFKGKAYLSSYQTLADVLAGRTMPLISPGRSTYYEAEGYPCIGDVTMSIDIDPEDQILANQREALQASLVAARAEYEKQVNATLVAIGKL
jgi:hypothetical protein